MNSSAYYLGEVLEQLIHYVIDLQKELKEVESKNRKLSYELDKGILTGHYIIIGKLFDAVASLGIFKALPKDLQKDITPLWLVEDLRKGYLRNILQLRNVFRITSQKIVYGELNLKALLEELISEGTLLQNNLQSTFDEGKLMGYSFCLLTLYNQVEFFIPKLFKTLPEKLRRFVPESLSGSYQKQ